MKIQVLPKTSCPVSVPVNFDADEILKRRFDGIKIKADKIWNLKDAMYFILHSIIQQTETRRGRELMEDDGLIPLHSDVLRENCGNRYKAALTILEDEGVIYRDSSYSAGNYSMGACLIGKYAGSEYESRELTDKKFTDRVLKHRLEQDRINKAELDKLLHITRWFNKKLTMDIDKTHNLIELHSFKLKKSNKSKKKAEDIENRVNVRYNNSLNSARRIINGDFGLTRTGTDKRLHSAVSSMKKELRPFLSYDGKPLVGVDVKSSQPYLFTQLLKAEFYKKSKTGLDLYSLYPNLADIISIDEVNSILMSVSYGHSFDEVVWEDDFYDYLTKLDEAEYKDVKRVFKERAEVKHTIMMTLYDKKHRAAGFERFEQMFPKEAKLINMFHRISFKTENYLPILMQRLESKLMLEMVCKEVSKRLPDAPIIPVHDSILTTEEYQLEVKDIMHETLYKYTGVKPGLKLENETATDNLNKLDDIVERDLEKIYSKKPKRNTPTSAKSPLSYQLPEVNGDKVFSTRYIDPKSEDDPYEPVVNAENNELWGLDNS